MEYVEVARARSDRGELVLRRRQAADADTDQPHADTVVILELGVNGVLVMDTAENSSEGELALTALDLCATPRSVLIGGLGLGFTTHQVLADPRVESVVVAEIEDTLVRWMRDGTVPHGPAYLADQRLHVRVGDVQQVVAETAPAALDLVLLDVDNGPEFLVYEQNAAIYESVFIQHVREALRPGGVLVIWSSTRDEDLLARMEEVYGNSEASPIPVTLQDRTEEYWLHVARHTGES